MSLPGFDGTSNVLAGKLYDIPVRGTHAHAYVTAFADYSDCQARHLVPANGSADVQDLLQVCLQWRPKVASALSKLTMHSLYLNTVLYFFTAFSSSLREFSHMSCVLQSQTCFFLITLSFCCLF